MVDIVKAYLDMLGSIPELSEEEKATLPAQIKAGNSYARNRYIEGNMKLAVSIAKKYHAKCRHLGIDLQDLISEGSLALMKAVDGFDHTKGFKFSTYAHKIISQSIGIIISKMANVGSLSDYDRTEIGKFLTVFTQLSEDLRREPTLEEIANEGGMDIKKVRELALIKLSQNTTYLDAPIGYGDNSEGDLIRDENADPHIEVLAKFNSEGIKKLLPTLTFNEERIVRLRLGLEGERMLSLEEIGKKLEPKLMRVEVRQLEAKALRKLQCRRDNLNRPND